MSSFRTEAFGRRIARLRALGDGDTTLVADLLEVLVAHAGRTRRAGRG